MGTSHKNFITSDQKLVRCSSVHEKKIMDEIALLHCSTGHYYTLNPTGAAIWEYCGEGRSLQQILNFVRHEYQIENKILEEEIGCYLQELVQEGILEIL